MFYQQICKDKDEAEVWFVGLKALITHGSYHKWKIETRSGCTSSDGLHIRSRKTSPTVTPYVRSMPLVLLSFYDNLTAY